LTIVPMFKRCPKCKRKYLWNPDIGQMRCPYCGSLGMPDVGNISWDKIKKYVTGYKE